MVAHVKKLNVNPQLQSSSGWKSSPFALYINDVLRFHVLTLEPYRLLINCK